jgi:predicted RNase H-like nuclease (RuvC/YqgF family)
MDRDGRWHVILYASDIAAKLGWHVKRAQRLLQAEAYGMKIGGRWATTLAKLREHDLDLYEELRELQLEREAETAAGCRQCDDLRVSLMEKDKQIDELARRLGESADFHKRRRG